MKLIVMMMANNTDGVSLSYVNGICNIMSGLDNEERNADDYVSSNYSIELVMAGSYSL